MSFASVRGTARIKDSFLDSFPSLPLSEDCEEVLFPRICLDFVFAYRVWHFGGFADNDRVYCIDESCTALT